MNLDAYFKRIGFDGFAEAKLVTLQTLHRLHIEAIPLKSSYRIIDAAGTIVMQDKADHSSLTVDISSLRSGIYIVQILTDLGTRAIPFVVR